MLGKGAYEIKTVSLLRDCVQSIGGFSVVPDYDRMSAPKGYESLILIGSMTWRNEGTQQIQGLVRDCFEKGKELYCETGNL